MKIYEEIRNTIPAFTAMTLSPSSSGIFSPHHWHDWYEILLLKEGRLNVTINNQTFCLNANDLILIHPFDIHSTTVLTEGASFLVILFGISIFNLDDYSLSRSKYLDVFMDNNHLDTGCLLSPFTYETEIRLILERLYETYQQPQLGSQMMIKGLLYELIAYLQNIGHSLFNEKSKTDNPLINKLCKYIEEHYRDGITVGQVAQTLGYSDAYLSRLFHKVTGRTLKSYIDYVRIQEAAILLQYEKLPINEIADRVGYENQNSFSRAFKRVTHCRPTDIR